MLADEDKILTFGEFALDRADERLVGPSGPIKVGNKAYQVLLLLAQQGGRLLTKEALFSSVWDGTIVSESALTSVIKELRRALGDESRTPRYIESVYGRGYRLIAPVNAGKAPRPASAARSPAPPEPEPEGRPPLVLVTGFNDDAIRDRHPHFSAALREEVLSGLARFREIRLIADSRAEAEAGAGYGRRSARDYQLTATLLPDGDGVMVYARAKRLLDGQVVWAEKMALADIGTSSGVEKIVRRIAGAALPAVDEDVLLGLPRESDDFYDRYLIAKHQSFAAADHQQARAAAEALERLIEQRPDFGLAYPPLVRLYNIDFGYTGLGSSGLEERARALALAKAGLAADRGNVHAFTVLGFCHLWHGERDLALHCFQQALVLNPYNPVRLNEVAAGMTYLGDFEKARTLFDLSLSLQPFADDDQREDRSRLMLLAGDFDAARKLVKGMTAKRLWPSLYAALADHGSGHKAGPQLAAWRSWIERCWVGARPLTTAELKSWVHFHHPVSPDHRPAFEDLLDAGLAQAEDEPLGRPVDGPPLQAPQPGCG